MKVIKLIFLLTISSISIHAQEGYIKVEKDNYKIDELIKVTFYTFKKVDSVSYPNLENFSILTGPFTQQATSIVDGETKFQYVITYTLKAKKEGEIIIESPTYYSGLKTYSLKETHIKIERSNLTQQEQEDIRFQTFKDRSIHENGTKRYIIGEEFGYLEVFKDLTWQFERKLSPAEYKKLKKIN